MTRTALNRLRKMNQCGENLVLCIIAVCVISTITGIILPSWYRQDARDHDVNTTSPSCVLSTKVQEGLWKRYCYEYELKGDDCVLIDIEEWCSNLDYPDFNVFVMSLQVAGLLFILFAAATIIKSKIYQVKFKMEMVGAENGLGGLLMLIGVMVYAAADSGEISYDVTDLHVGWGMCMASGSAAVFLGITCFCLHIHAASSRYADYTLIMDDYAIGEQSDDDLIDIV